MQRPDNPFLFSISCCSFGDEERDFRRRNSNKALSTPRKDDWAAILNDRTRPVGFTATAVSGCDSDSAVQHRQEPRWSPRPKDFLQNTGPAPEELVEKTQQQWARVEARRSTRNSASTSRAPSALSNSSYHSPNGSRAVGSTFNDLANLFLQVRCVLMRVSHHAHTYFHPLYIRTRPRLLTPTRATDRRTQPEKPSHINLFHGFHSPRGSFATVFCGQLSRALGVLRCHLTAPPTIPSRVCARHQALCILWGGGCRARRRTPSAALAV